MHPLFLLIKRLEGKPESGANGFISEVLPAFDLMEDHLAEQLEAFDAATLIEGGVYNKESRAIEGAVYTRSMGHTNTLNAQAKLLKYKRLNTSVVLFAACVLVPWRKWEFFEGYMALDKFEEAKTSVQYLWESKYAHIIVQSGGVVDLGGEASAVAAKVG
jgi:hypothetical protein